VRPVIEFFAYLTRAVGENVPAYMAIAIIGLAVLLVLVLVLCPSFLRDRPRPAAPGQTRMDTNDKGGA
jgi:hypothetical protein